MFLRPLMITSSLIALSLGFGGYSLFAGKGSGEEASSSHMSAKKSEAEKSVAELDAEIEALTARLQAAQQAAKDAAERNISVQKKAASLSELVQTKRAELMLGGEVPPHVNPVISPPAVVAALEATKPEIQPSGPGANQPPLPPRGKPTPPSPAKTASVSKLETPAPEAKPAPTGTPAKTPSVSKLETPAPGAKPAPTGTPAKTASVSKLETPAPGAKPAPVKPVITISPAEGEASGAPAVDMSALAKSAPPVLGSIPKVGEKLTSVTKSRAKGPAGSRRPATRKTVEERNQEAEARALEAQRIKEEALAAVKIEEERLAAEEAAKQSSSLPNPTPAQAKVPPRNVLGGSLLKSTGRLPVVVPEEIPAPSPAPTKAEVEELPAASDEVISVAKPIFLRVKDRKRERNETDADVMAEAIALYNQIAELGNKFQSLGLTEFSGFASSLLSEMETGRPSQNYNKDYNTKMAFLTNLEKAKAQWGPEGLRRWRDILTLDDGHRNAMFAYPNVYSPRLFSNVMLKTPFVKADPQKLSRIAQNNLFPGGRVTDELLEKYLEIPGLKLTALIDNKKTLAALQAGGPKAQRLFDKLTDSKFGPQQIKTWDPEKAATDEQIPSPGAGKPQPDLKDLTKSLPPMKFGTSSKPKETPEQKTERLTARKAAIEADIAGISAQKAFLKRQSIVAARKSLDTLKRDFNDQPTNDYVKQKLEALQEIEDALGQ